MSEPALSSRAAADLRRIDRTHARAARGVVRALEAMGQVPAPKNLDVKAIAGRPPWPRMRVGDWRLLYRPLSAGDLKQLARIRGEPVDDGTLQVARIVNRRDLERVIAALP